MSWFDASQFFSDLTPPRRRIRWQDHKKRGSMKLLSFALLAVPAALAAQTSALLPLDWDKLSANATERVDVTLDGNMLQTVAGFLSSGDKDGDDVELKKLLAGLKGVYVHSYTFGRDNAYAKEDLDVARARLKSDHWNRIVQSVSHENGENTEIYLKSLTTPEDIPGLVILCAEPRELTVVHIAGKIDPEQVGRLSGKFGIPDLGEKHDSKAPKE